MNESFFEKFFKKVLTNSFLYVIFNTEIKKGVLKMRKTYYINSDCWYTIEELTYYNGRTTYLVYEGCGAYEKFVKKYGTLKSAINYVKKMGAK